VNFELIGNKLQVFPFERLTISSFKTFARLSEEQVPKEAYLPIITMIIPFM